MKTAVALIIPVFNEHKTIAALIRTIREQTYPPAEVILVDGGSTDDTAQLATDLTKDDPRFQIIRTERAMPGKGRNIGAAHTRCEWIAFTDAGITLDKHWLELLVQKKEEDPNAAIVYGNFSPQVYGIFDKCAAIAYVPPMRPGAIRTRSIASCLLKKEVWEKTGGFPDWRATEDLVFMEKADQLGFRYATAPDAIVYWQLRPGLGSTFKKFELYSQFNVWAGRQAYWHYGIGRQYLVMLAFLMLGIFLKWYFLLAIPLWASARVLKRTWSHRYEYGTATLLNPGVFFMVMLITISIDLATFSGWLKALFNREEKRRISQY